MIEPLMKFHRIKPISFIPRRRFWAWLNIIWNRVDEPRIKELGPDMACAEWLIRNGAIVKWAGDPSYTEDYNALPSISKNTNLVPRFIEEVDATNSSIMHIGFPYLIGCKHIRKIKLHSCNNIENRALKQLSSVKESLQDLHISSCGNVSDDGIISLQALNNLKRLFLFDLPEVTKPEECIQILKTSLQQCNIEYKRVDSAEEKPEEPQKET